MKTNFTGKFIFVRISLLTVNLPDIESSEDSVKQQDPAPAPPPHCYLLSSTKYSSYDTQLYSNTDVD